MKMTMIFCVDVLSSHTEVSKWGNFEENWCFLIFYKGKFPVLKKYLLISFKWAGMSKNLFLILFCICVTIENWVMRQRTNVDKLVICNFLVFYSKPKIGNFGLFPAAVYRGPNDLACCHSPNSTSTQPQLNSTELGLTWKLLQS